MKKLSLKGCLKGCLTSILIGLIVFIGLCFIIDTEPPVMHTQNQTVEYGTKLDFSQLATAEDDRSDNVEFEILSTDITGLTINNEDKFILCDKAGIYELEIAATDENGNQTTETVLIDVTDTQAPKILATQDDYNIGYNEAVDIFSQYGGIKLQLDEASDYTVSLVNLKNAQGDEVADLYEKDDINNTIKILKMGSYVMEFMVADCYGNSATDFATIEVLDKTIPTLISAQETFVLADSATKGDYIKGLVANDEIDGDLTSLIQIDDSKVKYGSIGEYQILASVTDKSGNICTQSFPVIIEDKTAPTLTLSKTSFSLTAGDSAPDYSSIVSATDGIDGNVTSLIQIDDSAVNYDKAGTYKVKVTVTDNSGNSTTQNITVKVKKASSKLAGDITSSGGGSGRQVMVTKTGECYHTHKCGNGNYYWVSYETALARGLRACKKCY